MKNSTQQKISKIIQIWKFEESDQYPNFLFYALKNNKTRNLNLTSEDLQWIFEHSDLRATDLNGQDALMCAFLSNGREELRLTEKNFDYLIENSNKIAERSFL